MKPLGLLLICETKWMACHVNLVKFDCGMQLLGVSLHLSEMFRPKA